ncbi:P-loop containing nucleoside triphosphate hydrolase protein [Cladorrhinum sp. PSN259]|nr:P-loop containing nucleoside triphosphate hydrolase protein [Cladorrhinum sp. PSN259]
MTWVPNMPFSTGEDLLQLNQNHFDFNIQFEQLFFSIIPSVLFIITSAWRTFSQARKPTVVNAPAFQLVKMGTITIYVGLELSLLIMVAIGTFRLNSIFTVSSVLKLVASLFMISLSLVDHSKSARPSMLLNGYLFLTLLLDAVQVRTLFMSSSDKPELAYSSIFGAAIALKVAILILEAQRKSGRVGWDEKNHSPEETSSIFSLGVFFWLNRLFLDGYNKVLTVSDLYPLDSSLSSTLLHERFAEKMGHSRMSDDKNALLKAILSTLKFHILLPIPARLALIAFTVSQPFFIQRLLEHLTRPDIDDNVGYGFIGASVLIYSGIAISTALFCYFHHRMKTMLSSILIKEIFVNATRLWNDSAALTLMSTDMERIHQGLLSLHDIWACTIQAAIAGWMLYKHLGVVFVAPMGLVMACFLGLGVMMRFVGDSQRKWMQGVQKRVGLTAAVVSNMKNLKISGLSAAIEDFVQNLRVQELAAGVHFRQILIGVALFGFIPLLLGPPITFASAQRALDTTTIFASLSWLLLLTNPLTMVFEAIPRFISALACLGRIQTYLESKTHEDVRKSLANMGRIDEGTADTDSYLSTSTCPLVIEGGSFGWEPDTFILRDIHFQARQSSLTIVVGPIGSGKSTLCKALLGEMPFSQGTVLMNTAFPRVGYCDQVPFLFNGSVRDNIVGFSPFFQERYDEVLAVTALNYDLNTLPQGDLTNVGSNGITLSGGQKQRVSLARALYLQTNLLIFDDIFSGLDADTEEQVFRSVFGPDGLLRRRQATAILCTHSIRHLPGADHIVVLENGTVLEQGSLSQLMARQGYVRKLGLTDSSRSVTSSEKSESSPNKPTAHLAAQLPPNSTGPDAKADLSRQVGDWSVYRHYFKSMGFFLIIWSLFFAAGWGFFTNFSTIWLKYWSEDSDSSRSFSYYAGIYALLQAGALLSLLLIAIALYVTSVKRAGANVHRQALQTLLHAPLRFFTSTDTGVVINLFSQDLNLLDTDLPNGLLNTLGAVFASAGQGAVMLSLSPYIAISYPFLIALLYFVQRFYLRTSRQLRLLDLEAKSPLYTHFLDTVNGIATLRAFGFIREDIEKNADLLDTSQRPAYLLVMIQQWLTLVLDLVVMVMATVLTVLAVRLHSNSGFTGASLVTLMSFGENLSGIVIYYTRLETSIGAIARLKTFNETVKPEDKDHEDITPPEQWPEAGVIELKGISASYAEEKEDETLSLALRNIHLTISSGENIAICGRTGSGKSSLIAFLLKLLDPTSDTAVNAVIDNTPLYRIDRSALRQRIIAVPQEAVFLPDGATFRANLDPLDVSTPEQCQEILVAVKLWDFVHERGGIDAGMSSGTLSAGQRQLMSLGRALLRRRKRAENLGIGGGGSEGGILLLDEVSSSVDHETERSMQEIIRNEFRNYTVLAVSHRLDMIMDFDRVIVMDKGEIVEVGNPEILAGKEGTRFRGLVRAAQ